MSLCVFFYGQCCKQMNQSIYSSCQVLRLTDVGDVQVVGVGKFAFDLLLILVIEIHTRVTFNLFYLFMWEKSYYDTFLKRYEDRAKAKGWSNPLMGIGYNQTDTRECCQQKDQLIIVFFVQITVALSYSPQILEDGGIPVTPNDVMIDALVTPSGVVPITPPAIERLDILAFPEIFDLCFDRVV